MLSQAEGVAAIELNISCPNIKEGGIQFGCSLNGTYDVVSAVKKATHLPVIPKLTPNVTDVASFARAAEDAGADAVSLVNTFLAMAIDVETRRPKITNVLGGLSGPAIRPIAVRMVWECYQLVKIPIIGMGGITDARDAIEFMLAGATAVQIGTQNFVDPFVWSKVLDGLTTTCTRHKVAKLSELIGAFDPTPTEDRSRMNPILVALDVESAAKAIELADQLRGTVGGFKIGKQLFTAAGPAMVRELTSRGDRVFLDLKFHDIPNTVAGAVQSAVATGAWMVNVHASGGSAMMRAAAEAAKKTAAALGRPRPLVIGVTVLTSMTDAHAGRGRRGADRASTRSSTSRNSPGRGTRRRRRVAAGNARDSRRVRTGFSDCDAGHQAPSTRKPDSSTTAQGSGSTGEDDQARTLTPAEAIAAGATYLVIGRPITGGAQSARSCRNESRLCVLCRDDEVTAAVLLPAGLVLDPCRRAIPCPC